MVDIRLVWKTLMVGAATSFPVREFYKFMVNGN
jgi:hypothetical protein